MKYIKTNNRGFTIIEYILVIAITVITSMLILPQFGLTFNNIHLELASTKIMDDIRYVQNYAVTNHCNTWFAVDVANNSYSYGYYATDPYLDPQLITDPSTNQTSQIQVSNYSDIEITNESFSTINFDWFGEPSASGVITLNSSVNINITGETGYVYVN